MMYVFDTTFRKFILTLTIKTFDSVSAEYKRNQKRLTAL